VTGDQEANARRDPPSASEAGFSRVELDRVIRRATELQFEDSTRPASGDLVDREELLRIGAEVGIEARHLQRALGELRAESLRPEFSREGGFIQRLAGTSLVRVSRVVPGNPGEVDARLAEHLSIGESLTRIRRRGDRSLWEPAGGMLAGMRRALKWRGFNYDLARAGTVEVAVSGVEEGRAIVTMLGDLGRVRAELAGGWIGGLGLTGGVLSGLVGLAAGWPVLAVGGLLAGIGVGRVIAVRELRSQVSRLSLSMEGILDRLESGEPLATKRDGWGVGRKGGG
jgi:hypothetical protein